MGKIILSKMIESRPDLIENCVKLYESGMSCEALGKKYKICSATVRRIILKYSPEIMRRHNKRDHNF